ncbi:unnamed protein product [Trichobilharzia szidati]|nr:unnamed protein product [Trichobilharzia szidati]
MNYSVTGVNLLLYVTLLHIIWSTYQKDTMADFLFRIPNSHVILSEFQPCPSSKLYLTFLSAGSTGLLMYAENNKTGQFFALTLLPGNRIKLEMELRPPQYRVTRAHTTMTLDYSQKHNINPSINWLSSRVSSNLDKIHSTQWNYVEISFHSKTEYSADVVRMKVNEFHTQIQLSPSDSLSLVRSYSKPKSSLFGPYVYIGQIPDAMRSDATERALFSVAMQSSFQGIIKDIRTVQCVDSKNSKRINLLPLATECMEFETISLENGAVNVDSDSFSSTPSFCFLRNNQAKLHPEMLDGLVHFDFDEKSKNTMFCGNEPHNTLNLNGQNYAKFHFTTVKSDESIFLEFRTRDENQMMFSIELFNLWKTEVKKPVALYLHGYLLNGSLIIRPSSHFPLINSCLNDTERLINCLSDYNTCADTQWHSVVIMIKQNDLFVVLDNQSFVKLNCPTQRRSLAFKTMYIGTNILNYSEPVTPQRFPVAIDQAYFRGCFRSLLYKTGDNSIPLLATDSRKHIQVEIPPQSNMSRCDLKLLRPKVNINLEKKQSFISFTRPGSFLRTRGWKVVLHGEITFLLRTTTLNGLILYSNSVAEHKLYPKIVNETTLLKNVQGLRQMGFDIFALEIRLGRLHFLVNTGSGIVQPEFSRKYIESESKGFVSDGNEHAVQIVFDEGDVTINVDGKNFVTYGAESKTYKYLNLNEHFYIGGLPEPIRQINSFISPDVWSAQLRHDFVGCLGNFTVNKQLWDIDLESRSCWSKSSVKFGCTLSSSTNLCTDNTCTNNAHCLSDWNQSDCECTLTGKPCIKNPITVSFNGFQWIWIKISPLPIQSAVEELTLRFKTRYRNGFLLTTRSSMLSAPDCLELKIISGYLVLIYNLGAKDNVYHSPVFVADNSWHTVKVYRRENVLNFTVDQFSQYYDIPKDGRYLSHHHLIFGSSEKSLTSYLTDTRKQFSPNTEISSTKDHVFIGYLSTFLFNGVDFLRVAQNLNSDPSLYTWRGKIDITATESGMEPIYEMPLSFSDLDSNINIQLKNPASGFTLQTRIKWKKRGAILFLHDDFNQHFILELADSGFQLIQIDHSQLEKHNIGVMKPLVDIEWYHIKVIKKPLMQAIIIQINNQSTHIELNKSSYFSLKSINIGGLSERKSVYPVLGDYLQSAPRFQGCLASFSLNHSIDDDPTTPPKLINHTVVSKYQLNYLHSSDTQNVKWHNVQIGCRYSNNKFSDVNQCSENSCHFNGICSQQWNSTSCDCSLTGFTGRFCENFGPSIHVSKFPERHAVIELNSPQNTTLDRLAFGIEITHPGTMTLIHIQGQGQSPDYIQVTLLHNKNQQNLAVQYNMGGGTQTLFQQNVNLNDGHFHVVQFIRHEAKGILRIDFQNEISKTAEDKNNKHFNSLKRIYIGKSPNSKPQPFQNMSEKFVTRKGFEAFLTGLNLNGIDLIDVLVGNMVPGIYLKSRKNIEFNPNFKSNIKNLKTHYERSKPGATNHKEANDMQLSANDLLDKVTDYKPQPIVVPKSDCSTSNQVFNYEECQPADEDGIIRPFVTFNNNYLMTVAAADKNEPQQGWNADQSNNNKQSQTTYMNSIQNFANLDQSIAGVDEMGPLITSWFSPSDKLVHEETGKKWYETSNMENHRSLGNTLHENSNNIINSFIDRNKKFPFNIVLIIAVSISGICLLIILTCIIYRYMRRDEGTYRVEETTGYTTETPQVTDIPNRETNTVIQTSLPLISLPIESVKLVTLLKDSHELCDLDGGTLVKLINESASMNEKTFFTSGEIQNTPDVILTDKSNNDPNNNNKETSTSNTVIGTSTHNRISLQNGDKRKSKLSPKEWYV